MPSKIEKYSLSLTFNDETFKCKTDDLAEAISSFKPILPRTLKTRIILKVKKGKKVAERMLYVPQGKMLFRNKVYLNNFISRLIFK